MKRKKKRKEKGKEKGKGKGKEKGKRNGKEKRNKGKEKGEIKWSSLLLFESILYAMLRNSLKNRCTNNYIGCKVKHKDMSQPGLSFSQPPTYTSYHQHWLHVLKLIAVSIWVFSELYEEYSVKKSRSYSHMYLCAVSKSCLLFSIDIFHILDMESGPERTQQVFLAMISFSCDSHLHLHMGPRILLQFIPTVQTVP